MILMHCDAPGCDQTTAQKEDDAAGWFRIELLGSRRQIGERRYHACSPQHAAIVALDSTGNTNGAVAVAHLLEQR